MVLNKSYGGAPFRIFLYKEAICLKKDITRRKQPATHPKNPSLRKILKPHQSKLLVKRCIIFKFVCKLSLFYLLFIVSLRDFPKGKTLSPVILCVSSFKFPCNVTYVIYYYLVYNTFMCLIIF